MKKLYYFLALIGIVACSTDSIDVYDGDQVDRGESNIATIAFDTEVDPSLADLFVQYFGESYADRSGLEVTLTGKMAKEDFADIKGVTSLDMSGVTLVDGTLPTNAFAGSSISTLVLPTTETLKYVEDGAFKGTYLTKVSFAASVETIGDDLFDEGDTLLTSIYILALDENSLPTISESSFPYRFTEEYVTTPLVGTGGVLTSATDYGTVYVAMGTLYFYKQISDWTYYNIGEDFDGVTEGFINLVVYVESVPGTTTTEAIPDLENEIIDLLGSEYVEMDSLNITVMGTLISEDFDVFTNADFSHIDIGQVTILGDILIQSQTGTMEGDLYWNGNAIPFQGFRYSTMMSLVLPPSLEAIGRNAINSCSKLTSITYPDNDEPRELQYIAYSGVGTNTSLADVSFINEAYNLQTLCNYAFGGSAIESINIPQTVDSLGIWILNASEACEYVLVNWDTAETIPSMSVSSPPFPSQFNFGNNYYITIPDGTRELYEATNWSMFNLKEMSEVREAQDWVLLFEDNFDELDTTIWSFAKGFSHDYEVQYFTEDNAKIVDGKLVITAKAETIYNEEYIPDVDNNWVAYNEYADYTSSWLTTKDFNFLWGRVEVHAKIPSLLGVAPTVATVGISEDVWPSCGQANVVTNYYDTYIQGLIYSTSTYSTAPVTFESDEAKAAFADEFHTWVMYWSDDQSDFYLFDDDYNEFGYRDSTLIWSVAHSLTTSAYDAYHCLGIGITLGAKAGDLPVENVPVEMEIDYIKVSQEQWIYVSPNN